MLDQVAPNQPATKYSNFKQEDGNRQAGVVEMIFQNLSSVQKSTRFTIEEKINQHYLHLRQIDCLCLKVLDKNLMFLTILKVLILING